MARLDFGLWDAVGGYSEASVPMADVYDEHIRLAADAEGLGYHSYFVIEHQNSPIGRITAPSVYLTAVARATSKLRIGAMIGPFDRCGNAGHVQPDQHGSADPDSGDSDFDTFTHVRSP